jgi:hypothetical protein
MATYPAEPFVSVTAVSISPLLVASKSPWSCFSRDILARVLPSTLSSGACGFSLTSNVPAARAVTVVPFWTGADGRFRGFAHTLETNVRQRAAMEAMPR